MNEKENNILQNPILDFSIISVPDQQLGDIKVTGSNKRKLLIVCQEEASHTTNINLLKKILEAVKFNLEEDCHLICLPENQAINFNALHKKEAFENVLVFGPIAKRLGLNFEYNWYHPLQHADCQYLFAQQLSVIADDRSHKGALWGALQQMFL